MSTTSSLVWNTSFGSPLSPGAFLVTHLTLSFCVGLVAISINSKVLKLSLVPVSLLWAMYYSIAIMFHLSAWLGGDAASYGFVGPAAIHVYVETLLCIKCLSNEQDVDWWGRAWSCYYVLALFVSFIMWHPMHVFVFGSILALPVDSLTIPAALAVVARSPARYSPSWWLGLTWLLNGPIIAWIFFLLIWNAKEENNMVGLGALALQVQYVCMGGALISVFANFTKQGSLGVPIEEDQECVELGILPTKDSEDAKKRSRDLPNWVVVGGMKRGLQIALALVGVQFLVSVLFPIYLGNVDVEMIAMNACRSFAPGNPRC